MRSSGRGSAILTVIVAVSYLTGMAFATMFDFEISAFLTRLTETDGAYTAVYPVPSLILEIIGEWPSTLFGAFCGAVIMRALLKKKSAPSILLCAAFSTLMLFIVFRAFHSSVKTLNFIFCGAREATENAMLMIIPLTIIVSVALVTSVLMLPQKTADKLLVPCIVCASMMIALLLGIELIKISVGRVRFRDLISASDVSGFSPWYAPNWFSGNKSFPSGHTANACAMALLPLCFSKEFKARNPHAPALTYATAALWTALMAFSRITVGAHYLSDVLTGGLIAFAAVMLGHRFMKRIREA